MSAITRRIKERRCDIIDNGQRCSHAATWEIVYEFPRNETLFVCDQHIDRYPYPEVA